MDSAEPGDSKVTAGRFSAEAETADSIAYGSVSLLAVAGMALGLLSVLALIGPMLWVVPALGGAFSLWAIRAIRRSDGAQVGEGIAIIGLGLSLAFGSAAVSARLTHDWLLRSEARGVAERWFDFLRHGEPHKALQLCQAERNRQPLDSTLWEFYRGSPTDRRQLAQFVADPAVHDLLLLGRQAQVRYWGTEEIVTGASKHLIGQVYAVTFEGPQRRQTFFIRIGLERLEPPGSAVQWRIDSYEGGIRPYERSNKSL